LKSSKTKEHEILNLTNPKHKIYIQMNLQLTQKALRLMLLDQLVQVNMKTELIKEGQIGVALLVKLLQKGANYQKDLVKEVHQK
jgi:hypothetical protein